MNTNKLKCQNRIIYLIIPLCACLLFSCAKPSGIGIDEVPEAVEKAVPVAEIDAVQTTASQALVGLIVPATENISLSALKHGFLHTAEILGYPGKLYYAAEGTESVSAVGRAAEDGCKGLVIWSPDSANDDAISKAADLGIPVVVPYHESESDGVSSNVVADVNGYMEEIALGIAERMVERDCKAGKILVYGKDTSAAYARFVEAIAEYYPQYVVASFTRQAIGHDDAINELATYILWNRDVKGMFCADEDGALIAVKARVLSEKWFKADGAPEKKTDAQPPIGVVSPGATPIPDGLTTQIKISVAGYGYSADNVSFIRSNDIYAFVLEPYYEASAQSLMLLDRILSGESVPQTYRLNMPIVRMATLDKYVLIDEQVREWFGLK